MATPRVVTETPREDSSSGRMDARGSRPSATRRQHAPTTSDFDGDVARRRMHDGGRGRARVRADEAASFPGHPRRPGGLQLRRGPVARLYRRGPGGPAHGPSGPGAVPAVFPRRLPHRLHRAVRRRRAGLRHPGVRRGAAAADVLSGARSAGAALGLRQPGLRLVARRAGGPVPVAALQHGPFGQPAVPGLGRRRAAGAAADARVRGGRPVAGRDAGRLLAAVPRLPDLEALRGGLGAGALHLRPRDARGRAGDDAPARRPRPDVDRQRDLLHLGPGRHAQPVQLRPRVARDDATHRQRHLGRALAG